MKSTKKTVTELKHEESRSEGVHLHHPAVARVMDVPAAGSLLLEFADGAVHRARTTAEIGSMDPSALVGREVLAVFERGDPDRPIAVALLYASFGDSAALAFDGAGDIEAEADGRHVVIRAEEKLELRCGKASIVIDAEGKVTIRGAHLLSRSTGPIRIKGGHVDIN